MKTRDNSGWTYQYLICEDGVIETGHMAVQIYQSGLWVDIADWDSSIQPKLNITSKGNFEWTFKYTATQYDNKDLQVL